MSGSPTLPRAPRVPRRPLGRRTTRPGRRAPARATGTPTVVLAGLAVVGPVLLEALALDRVLGRLADLPAAGGLVVVATVAGLVAGVVTVVLPAHHARHRLGDLAVRGVVAGLAATLVVAAAPVLATALQQGAR